jgi:hypothetical protein
MRPVKGYTREKKLKAAKKSLAHATKLGYLLRVEFWKLAIEFLSVVPKAKRS